MSKGLEGLLKFWPVVLSAVALIGFGMQLQAKADNLVLRLEYVMESARQDRANIEKRQEAAEKRYEASEKALSELQSMAADVRLILRSVIPSHEQQIKGLDQRVHQLEVKR